MLLRLNLLFELCRMLIKTLLNSRCSDLSENYSDIVKFHKGHSFSIQVCKETRKHQSFEVKEYINQTAKKAFVVIDRKCILKVHSKFIINIGKFACLHEKTVK